MLVLSLTSDRSPAAAVAACKFPLYSPEMLKYGKSPSHILP